MSSPHILSYSHAYMGAGHNGGAETTLHDFMRLLRAEKYDTTALLSKPHEDGSGSFVVDGVKVQAYASRKDIELYVPGCDLVVSHLGEAARASQVARKYGKSSIHLIHNDQEYCKQYAERYSDGMVFNTAWVQEKYDTQGRPWCVLHPPVDPNRYRVESSREYILLVNLTIGTERNSYDKGARTFYELAKRFPDLKFMGVMGGYGEQYVPDKLPKNVTIVPHTNNILQYYRKAKVVLMPSKYESYGRVPLEAACSAIPSVVTATNGTEESMGYSARYCKYGDTDEWEWGLSNVLYEYEDYCNLANYRAYYCWRRTLHEWNVVSRMIKDMIGG